MLRKNAMHTFRCLTLSYPRRLQVFKNRQVSWLMVIASYVFPSILTVTYYRLLPFTVAGPRWYYTNFPFKLQSFSRF
jgi:hypothetical protein